MMNINGTEIATIITSLTAMIMGIATLVKQFQNGDKVDRQREASTESAKILSRKIDETASKVDAAHAATNVLVASSTGVFRAMVAPDKEGSDKP